MKLITISLNLFTFSFLLSIIVCIDSLHQAAHSNGNTISSPKEILAGSSNDKYDNSIQIELQGKNPFDYMKTKKDLISLYFPNQTPHFKQTDIKSNNDNRANSGTTLPTKADRNTPRNKQTNPNEVIIPIESITSTSEYKEVKEGQIEIFSANYINNGAGFWCSEGSHDMNSIVDIVISGEKPFRGSSLWIHWAFAPGEYKIFFANSGINNNYNWITLLDWSPSIQNADEQFWKNILSNISTRWKYKSFDSNIPIETPTFAKYIKISMRLPYNQYFGIYSIEGYTYYKSYVMLKSKINGENLCLSPINPGSQDSTPVVALNCGQGILYTDNRQIFTLYSNNLIKTVSGDKCGELTSNGFDVINCAIAEEYKDDREKWNIDFNGKIRSGKDSYTCIGVDSNGSTSNDIIPNSNLKVRASSEQNDNLHNAEKAGTNENEYWASDLTGNSHVIFEIYFSKYASIVKELTIYWKFPAKHFKISVGFADGNWETLHKNKNNHEIVTAVNLKNKDYFGIKITMMESTTKINEKNVYGISSIVISSGTKPLVKYPCDDSGGNNSNGFEIIDITPSSINSVTGVQYSLAMASLRNVKNKMNTIQLSYMNIPNMGLKMKESSIGIKKVIDGVNKHLFDSIRNLKLKFEAFQTKYKTEEMKLFTLGSNKHFPVSDCTRLLKSFPSKRSGYYWIKNECMKSAMEVYCDFDTYNRKSAVDYVVYNEDNNINVPIKHNINKIEDIRNVCYNIGLEPVEIRNKKMINVIYNLLKMKGYDLSTNNIVPFAYDYTCDGGKCSNRFNSMNSDKSNDITELISDFIKDKNKQNNMAINYLMLKNKNKSGNNISNIACFGQIDNIVYDKLILQKRNINAIVCSTNKNGANESTAKPYLDLNCEDNLRSEIFMDYERFSTLRMLCPNNCLSAKANVYGTDVYTDNSSICKAAIHSGIIRDIGGYIEVTMTPGLEKYEGSERRGVITLNYMGKWDRSFKVKEFKGVCPIDNNSNTNDGTEISDDGNDEREVNSSSSSFIEVSTEDTVRQYEDKLRLLKEVDTGLKKSNGDRNKNTIMGENMAQFGSRDIEKGLTSIMKFNQKEPDHGPSSNMSSGNQKESLGNMNESPGNQTQNFYSSLKNDNEKLIQQMISASEQQSTHHSLATLSSFINNTQYSSNTHPSTSSYSIYFQNNFKTAITELDELKTFSSNLKGFIGETSTQIEHLKNDDLEGIESQKLKVKEIKEQGEMGLKVIYEIDMKIQNQRKRTEYELMRHIEQENEGRIREEFTENYLNNQITENWDIFSSKKGKGEKPTWAYYEYNINGHYKVIKQTGSFQDNRSGSHLILRKHSYYDFEITFSVNIKDDNTFGVCFRYGDNFNYYVFEMSNKDGGFKRIRKFSKGIETIIDVKHDGGFIKDVWYKVKIRCTQNIMKVYMTEESNGKGAIMPMNNALNNYDLQFKFIDNYLVSGKIAFASQGINTMLIDNISVVPLGCTNVDSEAHKNSENNAKIITLTPTCSRYFENFKNGFEDRWEVVDPIANKNGPSAWTKQYNIENNEIALLQNSLISGVSEYQEGSGFIMKDKTKVCTKGKFMVTLKPGTDQGIIGGIFRYKNNKNYYILELSSSFIRIRKKIVNDYHLVGINNDGGFQVNKYMCIILTLNGGIFNVFITQNGHGDIPIKVFKSNGIDNDLTTGSFGGSTYAEKIIITDITLNALTSESDGLYIDDETNNEMNEKAKIQKLSRFERENLTVKTFSWRQCLNNPNEKNRKKACAILFTSFIDIENCESNFCAKCCNKLVDGNNQSHATLCRKQCENTTLNVSSEMTWMNVCIAPNNPEKSIYNYCDDKFRGDYPGEKQCKVNLCNTCCITFDSKKGNIRMTDNDVKNCYNKCNYTFLTKKENGS